MDEDAYYAVAGAIALDHGNHAWMIFAESWPDAYRKVTPIGVPNGLSGRRTLRADTVKDLARLIDVPVSALLATVTMSNEQLPMGTDPDFLRHDSLKAKGIGDRWPQSTPPPSPRPRSSTTPTRSSSNRTWGTPPTTTSQVAARTLNASPIAALQSVDISNAVLLPRLRDGRYATGITHIVGAGGGR